MKKILKWIGIVILVLIVLKIGQGFFNGFDSSFAPNAAIEQAKQKAAENKLK